MRSINEATMSSTGGRPRRLRYVHFVVTKRRCQRRIVPGVTKRCFRSIVGNARTSAANTARSAQSKRGFGLALRSTMTSWRRISISMSLAAVLRASNLSQPKIVTEIKYSSRNSTARDHVMLTCSQ